MKKQVDSNYINKQISKGKIIEDIFLDENFELNYKKFFVSTDTICKKIYFKNCIFKNFFALMKTFKETVTFINCTFNHLSFMSGFFLKGLEITGCEIFEITDFQCGGHNKPSHKILIQNSKFHKFVNFFDCWYEGPFILKNCELVEGTNLLGNKNTSTPVSFDICPIIENNKGDLYLNGG